MESFMYVVDYPRQVQTSGGELTLVIPPFHTGPVGLLPDSEVHLSVSETDEAFTILITPYQLSSDMMHLSCTMENGAGIVPLMDAVSELGVNIVNAFSSKIDDLGKYEISLVLDWS